MVFSRRSIVNRARGLKQGDLLSLYLFILVVEAFIKGFKHQLQLEAFVPYFAQQSSTIVTPLCFEDDILLFMLTSGDQF